MSTQPNASSGMAVASPAAKASAASSHGSSASARLIANVSHSHAVRPDGVAWGWGHNLYGQVGDGTVTTRNQPRIMAGITGAIAAGHTRPRELDLLGAVFAEVGTAFQIQDDVLNLVGEEALRGAGREPDTVTHEELLESAARLVADIVADVRASTGDVPPRRRGNL